MGEKHSGRTERRPLKLQDMSKERRHNVRQRSWAVLKLLEVQWGVILFTEI